MKTTDHPIGDPSELAAWYCAGAMTADEVSIFEAHLASGCQRCNSEVHALDPVVCQLMGSVEPAPVDPRIRERLLGRVAEGQRQDVDPDPQVWKDWPSDPENTDVFIPYAMTTGWQDTEIEGIRMRRLLVDRQQNRMTALVRMAAGTSYPGHIHSGAEECLVLEGELHDGDHVLHAGDYERRAAGSHHGIQSTPKGCLLLIVSSLTDELV